jgi:hypothetical protein
MDPDPIFLLPVSNVLSGGCCSSAALRNCRRDKAFKCRATLFVHFSFVF